MKQVQSGIGVADKGYLTTITLFPSPHLNLCLFCLNFPIYQYRLVKHGCLSLGPLMKGRQRSNDLPKYLARKQSLFSKEEERKYQSDETNSNYNLSLSFFELVDKQVHIQFLYMHFHGEGWRIEQFQDNMCIYSCTKYHSAVLSFNKFRRINAINYEKFM